MKKNLALLLCIFLLSFLVAAVKKETSKQKVIKKMKKVVMVIAKNGFRDEEYFQPKEILTKAKIEVITASSSDGTAKGMLGAAQNIDITIDEIDAKNYDAIIFIGGIGATEYFENEQAYKIIQETISSKKILGAICIAPVILAKVGVLKNKKVTVFSSKSEINEIKKYGANYTGKNVEVDGSIVTASGPDAAKQFGIKILELLKVDG
ncbi:MAG: DJ-1/PfpI family protein [Elusimicrobiota bacterium]